jgi:DNA polymerase III subunit epsilon
MTSIKECEFVCIDVESTGLDPQSDRVIEIAVSSFTLDAVLEEFESLVNPQRDIPKESIAIHHITEDMVRGKPIMAEIFPHIREIIGDRIVIGHGIQYDIDILSNEAKRCSQECHFQKNLSFDTLRLARLYGESPSNSLEVLRGHFNIQAEGAHRAMSDVIVNIQVFKRLVHRFRTIEDIQEVLSRPIFMKNMPLGKHKGRPLKEIPMEYLHWAARQQFDQDLLFSLRSEIQRRKRGGSFSQVSNPFHQL